MDVVQTRLGGRRGVVLMGVQGQMVADPARAEDRCRGGHSRAGRRRLVGLMAPARAASPGLAQVVPGSMGPASMAGLPVAGDC